MDSAFDLQGRAADHRGARVHDELVIGSARVDKARALVAQLPAGSSILDVGCSDGAMLAPFVGRLDVHGVDASKNHVATALSRGVKAQVADVENLPYADGTFDSVFAGEVIEHTISPDRFLCEINRILKPEGVLILTAPNIRTPIGLAMLIYGIPPMFAARYRSEHFRDFTAPLLKAALRNNGFTCAYFTGSAFMLPKVGPRFSRLAGMFPNWADGFIVKAIKTSDATYDAANEFLPP